jgi:hypothetical protein
MQLLLVTDHWSLVTGYACFQPRPTGDYPAFGRGAFWGLCLEGELLWNPRGAHRRPPHPGFCGSDRPGGPPRGLFVPRPPYPARVCRRAGGPEPLSGSDTRLSSGTLVEVDQDGACRLGRMSGERLRTLGVALDLNTASAQDLEALPGVGPVLAGRIVQHRQTHGPFKTLDDLGACRASAKKNWPRSDPFSWSWPAPN